MDKSCGFIHAEIIAEPLQQIKNQGIIELFPSQLEEVYISYLSIIR